MSLLDDLYQRGYREAQERCTEHFQDMLEPIMADGQIIPPPPLTEDLIFQASAPIEDDGWGGWLTADDHSWEVLNCEPFTEEWDERSKAYVDGAERGANDWVSLQLIELDARTVETAVRAESPETAVMPREIMVDWLEDRDDPRAVQLRIALNPPDLTLPEEELS